MASSYTIPRRRTAPEPTHVQPAPPAPSAGRGFAPPAAAPATALALPPPTFNAPLARPTRGRPAAGRRPFGSRHAPSGFDSTHVVAGAAAVPPVDAQFVHVASLPRQLHAVVASHYRGLAGGVVPISHGRHYCTPVHAHNPDVMHSVAADIVAGRIDFPYRRNTTSPDEVAAWFRDIRDAGQLHTFALGDYDLHGFHPAGRTVTCRTDPVLTPELLAPPASAGGRERVGAAVPVTIDASNVTLMCSTARVAIPFDTRLSDAGACIVDYFSETARMRAHRRYDTLCPADGWRVPEVAHKVVDKAVRKFGELSDFSLRRGLYNNVPTCNLFRANVARALYGLLGGGRVLDMCAGWGCRMIGAMACPQVTSYMGYDPNPDLRAPHTDAVRVLAHFARDERAGGAARSFHVQPVPYEDGAQPPAASCNIALTSPPYFDLELYGSAVASENAQSTARHATQGDWTAHWFVPMLHTAWNALAVGGHLAIYVNDHEAEDGSEALDLCVPMLHAMAAVPDCVWVGAMGLQGETGKFRPLWIWRKGELHACPRPLPPLYDVLLAGAQWLGAASTAAPAGTTEPSHEEAGADGGPRRSADADAPTATDLQN